ncbi:hypothetical protein PAHAL_8G118900 [Panicum hallii]|jgi:hypothetical protein|uniref:Uncharacterized protein n=1 Tax=Panicum hallii TaxID=206008 RepID=A0A2T8I8K4_9POAL|nr:hypothetical protein PAHAL_8G118900 [Panicum hallii]
MTPYICCHLNNGTNKKIWQMPFNEMWQSSPDPFPCPHYKYLGYATRDDTETPSSIETAMAEGLNRAGGEEEGGLTWGWRAPFGSQE